MKMYNLILLSSAFFLLNACSGHKANTKKYYQYSYSWNYAVKEDSLAFIYKNPIHCTIRIDLVLEGAGERSKKVFWIKAKQDTTFKIKNNFGADPKVSSSSAFSTLEEKPFVDFKLSFPTEPNKKYKVMQGYNGGFSHHSEYSKYAIDFNLQKGETVYSAAEGYVVGVIKDYDNNGGGKEMRNQANFITIYHPGFNVFTQYVHLKYEGTLVKLGDSVKRGQPIGYSGNTGFSRGAHLHFNVLKATVEGQMKSVPAMFDDDVSGFNLKKGVSVRRRVSK